jgi:tryptophan synthase beta subunit
MAVSHGQFDSFFDSLGGAFVDPKLQPYLDELYQTFLSCINDKVFLAELSLVNYHRLKRWLECFYTWKVCLSDC